MTNILLLRITGNHAPILMICKDLSCPSTGNAVSVINESDNDNEVITCGNQGEIWLTAALQARYSAKTGSGTASHCGVRPSERYVR